MENIIEQKASAFIALIDHPILLVIFCVMLLLIVSGVAIIVTVNRNPNLVNNWLKSRKKVELDSGDVINERRHEKRRKADREYDTSIIERLDTLTLATEGWRDDISELRKDVDKLKEHQDESWTMLQKIKFYIETNPIQDRMIAGLTYIWWGGNGETRNDVRAFAYKNYEIYKTVITLEPKLKIKEIEERK